MSEYEILQKIQSVIAHELENEKEKVSLDANFAKDLGADYLDIIAIFMALEDAFEIRIPREEAKKLVTVKQVANYLSQKVCV